jgi:exonuclease III
MLSRFLLIFQILWLGIPSVSAIEIRIATYNVLTGIGNTGANGREELEAVIARINPDVLALQEVTGNDLKGPPEPACGKNGLPICLRSGNSS